MTGRQAKAWFAPMRYGYGAGLPIAWQGWAALIIYVIICSGAPFALTIFLTNTGLRLSLTSLIIAIASLIMLLVCAAKTRGGWRWRWGRPPKDH